MIFETKQEIRREIARHIRSASHLTAVERLREVQRIERLIHGIPLHLEMLAKHIGESKNTERIQEDLKRFTLAVSYKVGLLRYLHNLEEQSIVRHTLKTYRKR
jgi:predicted small metal-binding protein